MAVIRRVAHLCIVQLRQLTLTPTLYAFTCLLFVFFWHLNGDARKLQAVTGLPLQGWGYTAGVFSNPLAVLVFAMGVVALLSDLPLIRQNTVLEASRCSRNVWVCGRVMYIAVVTGCYTIFVFMLCALTSGGSLGAEAGWGKLLNTLANGYSFGEFHIPAEMNLCFTGSLTPVQAVLLSAGMAWGAAVCVGLAMLALALLTNRTGMLLTGSVLAVMDFVIYEKLPYWMYRVSPFSFMRLGIITMGDMPYYPTAWEAAATLAAAAVLLGAAALGAARIRRAGGSVWQRETM